MKSNLLELRVLRLGLLQDGMSGSSRTLADRIADSRKALTAYKLAELLSVSAISIFRLAKRGVIPAFRVGTSLRFCPAAIARWLRERGG